MKSLFLMNNAELGAVAQHNVALHLFALAWPGGHVAACSGPDGHPYGLKPFSYRRHSGVCHAHFRFLDGLKFGHEWFEHVGAHISLCIAESAAYLEVLPGVSSEGLDDDGYTIDRWGPDVDELPASVPENHVWRLRRWYCYNRAVYLCREAATKEQA